MRKLFIPVLFIVTLVGCGSKHLSPAEYSKYIADKSNGLIKSTEVGNTTIEVSYRPTDVWVNQELEKAPRTAEKISEVRKKYSPYLYFILSLTDDNKEALHQSGGQQYSDLLQTLSFRMNDYVTLTTSAYDTIPVGDFILNRTYGMSTSTDVLLVFNKEKTKGKDWIQFNLNEFGLGVGNQRFRFNTIDIENVPEINFNQNSEL